MNSFFSFHSYFVLNASLAVAYLAARGILGFSFFKARLTQAQRLSLARSSFLIAILSCVLAPGIVAIFPPAASAFQFEPLIKTATPSLLFDGSGPYQMETLKLGASVPVVSLSALFGALFLVGVGLFLGKYTKNIFLLMQLRRTAFCRHHIQNIRILFSSKTEIPFCWSFFKNYFVVIPNLFLEKSGEVRLALRHELQHIRQGDTQWLHILNLIRVVCFWNPFMKAWKAWFEELQEFACDESVLVRKKTSPVHYAQCLINAAATRLNRCHLRGVVKMQTNSESVLYRRVNMLFNYRKTKVRKMTLFFAYCLSFLVCMSTAYAFNGATSFAPLSQAELARIIQKSRLDGEFQIKATPELVKEINNIRTSQQARSFMQGALKRMHEYQPVIQNELTHNNMPNELLAVPLVESGYQPLDQGKNPVGAAGIWQIIPETAKHLNLTVSSKQDDRLDTLRSTQAALLYLKNLHEQFANWKLAVIAYEYGERNTEKMVRTLQSGDAWVLARSNGAVQNLSKFILMFDAAVVIMNNPALISG